MKPEASSRRTWPRLLAAAALAVAGPARALCVGSCNCSASTTAVVFAPYNPLAGGNDDSVGNVRVSCAALVGLAVPFSVSLSAGSGTLANRQMAAGAARLAYNLYTSAGYATVWGDGSGGTATVSGSILLDAVGFGLPQNLPVYGRIPAGQAGAAPGSYADTIVVTVTYN